MSWTIDATMDCDAEGCDEFRLETDVTKGAAGWRAKQEGWRVDLSTGEHLCPKHARERCGATHGADS